MKFALLGGVSALALMSGVANAQIVSLGDENSTVDVDLGGQGGMFNWSVDGTDHLFQQWFWYRIGNTPEQSIDTLGLSSFTLSNVNPFDPRDDKVFARYDNGRLIVEVSFALQGGLPGTGFSDIAEQIRITNGTNRPGTHPEALDLSFFQYSDFDLAGSPGGDSVEFDAVNPGNVVRQWDNGVALAETVVTPAANGGAYSFYPALLNSLNDAFVTNFAGFPAGPLGPGDCSWAYQWNFTLAPGQSFVISKDKQITPAPGAIALLGLGGLVVGRRRR